MELSINIISAGLIVIGTIAGGITLNPILLGTVNGAGLVLSISNKMKNYKEKIEMTKIAFTTYEKILVELRSALRGNSFSSQDFINKMVVIDEMIIDQTPLVDKFEKKYSEKC